MENAPEASRQSQSREAISAEISRLAGLPLAELRAAWAVQFRKSPPKGLWRDYLLRTLAWRLQEKAFGGLDKATLKRLEAYGRKKPGDARCPRLKAGTVLVREFGGTPPYRHDRPGWVRLAGQDLFQTPQEVNPSIAYL